MSYSFSVDDTDDHILFDMESLQEDKTYNLCLRDNNLSELSMKDLNLKI